MGIRYEPDHTAISVSNLDASVAWYQGMLGFNETQRFELPSMNARVAFLSLHGQYSLELFEVRNSSGLPAFAQDLVPDLITRGTKHLAFRVPDVGDAYRELRVKGVEFLFEPRRGGSGRYYTFFKDPDGILLEVIADKYTR